MKASFKLIVIFIALSLTYSCSLNDEGLPQDESNNGAINSDASQIVPGRYIVVFKDLVVNPAAEARMMGSAFGLTVGHVYENVFKGFSANIPDQALNGLKNNPLIDYIEPDITMSIKTQTIPTGIRRIAADKNLTAGINGDGGEVNVDAAIIDTGIDKEHPELNVVGGVRFYLGMLTDSRYDDDNGHGSHVAGIIAARDNADGVVGVAPGTRLWAVKVLNSRGSGYLSDIIKGIDWVRARANEIEVINMSLGGTGLSSAYRTAIQNCVNAGIVVVVAAGNESSDVYGKDGVFGTSDDRIPAAYPEVATISAMADSDGLPGGLGSNTNYGADDSFASFSNYSNSVVAENPVSSPGKAIDLILPGVSILSCYKDMNYATMSGTSMASPHAAGLVALYIAGNGRATNASGVYAIRQALIDAGKQPTDHEGINMQNDPDPNHEKLGWAGIGTAPINQPPTANFSYLATNLTVSFTDLSTGEGTLSWLWDFGDLSTSNERHPSHTYATDGTYTVQLTVTDNGGLTDDQTQSITVTSAPPDHTQIILTATYQTVKSRLKVNLTWTPKDITADIYRNGVMIATSAIGAYTDNVKNTTSYTYQVKSGGSESNQVTVPH